MALTNPDEQQSPHAGVWNMLHPSFWAGKKIKITTWDTVAMVILALTIILAAVIVVIFINPQSFLNPFPPPIVTTGVPLPTATETVFHFPPTWTPTISPYLLTPSATEVLTTSQTPNPSATQAPKPTAKP